VDASLREDAGVDAARATFDLSGGWSAQGVLVEGGHASDFAERGGFVFHRGIPGGSKPVCRDNLGAGREPCRTNQALHG
jgi:hypothetical protein